MTTEEMLEQRHTLKLLWVEPWEACGPAGNKLNAHLELRATIHDCINMSRAAAKPAGRPTMGEDDRHLIDFIVVHWATPDVSNVAEELPTGSAMLLETALTAHHESTCETGGRAKQVGSSSPTPNVSKKAGFTWNEP